MTLYDGAEAINSGVTFSVKGSAAEISDDGVITIKKGSLSDNPPSITCVATYNTKQYEKVITLYYSPNAYEISVYPSVIQLDSDGYPIDEELTIYVKK